MTKNVQIGRRKVKPKSTPKHAKPVGMTFETPADRLRQRRMALGYADAAEAARARGWNVRTYQAHESGKKEIGKKSIIMYAKSYGLTVDFLLTGKRSKNEKPNNTNQPPLAFRKIPLISLSSISGETSLKAMLAQDTTDFVLVSDYKNLGANARAFIAVDDSMMSPDPMNRDNIRSGEEIIFDPDKEYAPGNIVAAVLHNPERFVARRYGLIRSASGDLVIRLFPNSEHFPEDRIASEADGFILGRVVRIQSGRNL